MAKNTPINLGTPPSLKSIQDGQRQLAKDVLPFARMLGKSDPVMADFVKFLKDKAR